MQLVEFLERFREPITAAMVRQYPPLYDLAARRADRFGVRRLGRRPLGAQADAIRAAALSLGRHASTTIVGEMGTGKSFCGAAAAYLAGCRRVLVLAPPHLVRKWEREIRLTVPGARVAIVRRIDALERVVAASPIAGAPPHFIVLSREAAKLGYRWRPAAVSRLARSPAGVERDETGAPLRHLCCPRCGAPVADDDGVPLTLGQLGRKKHRCRGCGEALWQADPAGPRRYPLADYIGARLRGHFDLLIADECFPAGTPVRTPGGPVAIEDLRPGDFVVSYRDGRLVDRRVVRTIQKRSQQRLVKVTHAHGSFICTPNHKIYTAEDGYAPAGRLGVGTGLVHLPAGGVERADHQQGLPHLRRRVQALAAAQARGANVQPQVRGATTAVGGGDDTADIATPAGADLRAMRRRVHQPQAHALLRQELCREGAVGGPRVACRGDRGDGTAFAQAAHGCLGADASVEPGSGDSRAAGSRPPGPDLPGTTGRQWAADAGTAALATGDWLDYRVCDRDGRTLMAVRDGRFSLSTAQDRDRVRRRLTPLAETAESGCPGGGDAVPAGVDGAALLERAGHRRSRRGPGGGRACGTSQVLSVEPVASREEWVYDLEIEDTHCYFAGDILVSNCHEYKGRGSAQGLAAGELAGACAKTLTLTGTIFGGYASTIFHLLWRFDPALRGQFAWGDETKWVARYGIVKRISKRSDDHRADGRRSKRRVYDVRTVECPGVSPAMLSHLLPHTVFLRLADVSGDLPPFEERVLLCPLDRAARDGRPSQAQAYDALAAAALAAVRQALAHKSKRLLGGYLQALLSYPDACTRAEQLVDPVRGGVVAAAPALPADARYPKERELLALARRERERGRRLLVYVSHTESRDVTPRLRAILEEAGLRVAVLKAGTVAAERREEWIAARVAEGNDVLITNPKCVATGLDLFAYPAIAFYELEYSVYVLRQASRRSWRLGQRQPVEVTYLAYRGTLQAEALALVAAKVRAALLVEGELPEDGLAALAGEEQDQLLALARRLVDPDAADDSSLEALFAQARDADAAANGFLDAELADSWTDVGLGPVLEDTVPTPAPVDGTAPAPLPLPLPAPVVSPEPYASDAGAKVLRFEDLLDLAAPRRAAGRRKPAPVGQLELFG